MNNDIAIRPYEPQHDGSQVYALWQQVLSHHWPLSYETFHYTTVDNPAYQQGDHFVAQDDHDIVGFIGTQGPRIRGALPVRGELMLVLVAPAYQKQGIGRALHDQALAALQGRPGGQGQVAQRRSRLNRDARKESATGYGQYPC